MRNVVYVFIVVLAMSVCAAPGVATNLIANPSFETPQIGAGGVYAGLWQAPDGWNQTAVDQIFWTYAPPAPTQPDGTQSVIMWNAMFQNTGAQFQSGCIYTFSVYTSTWHGSSGWFWWGIGDPYTNGSVNEWYGGAELYFEAEGSDPGWIKHTASRTVPPGDPVIGKNIVFQLGSGFGGGFDLVELYAAPQSVSISYQGKLSDNGQPVNGTVNVKFDLFDIETGGSPVWSGTAGDVTATDGVFSKSIEPVPTSLFQVEDNLWLQITINGQVLSPRAKLDTAPYAAASFTTAQ